MRFAPLAIVVVLSTTASAQKTTGIKLYQNTDIFNVESFSSYSEMSQVRTEISFTRVSLALHLTGKKGAHEFEISVPQFRVSPEHVAFPFTHAVSIDPAYVNKFSSYSLRYEFLKTISHADGLTFALGGAINPYLIIWERDSDVPNKFDMRLGAFGMSLNFVPRLSYAISEKVAIEINVPFKIYDFKYHEIKIENPSIPDAQQTSHTSENIFFDNAYTIRVGITYNF